jgi:tellurite resistance protein TerC
MDNIPFGAFLIYTAIKMLLNGDEDQFEPKKSFVYKSLRKIMPISNHIDGEHFFIKRKHITAATPFCCLNCY